MVGQRSMEQRGGREFNREVIGIGIGIGTDYGCISQFICAAGRILELCAFVENGITNVIDCVIGTGLFSHDSGFIGTDLFSHDSGFICTGLFFHPGLDIQQSHGTDRRGE